MADDLPDGCVWDLDKNEANQKKHGISFAETCELFYSEADYVQIVDDAHSQLEPRFIVIGPIRRGLVLVAYTARDAHRGPSSRDHPGERGHYLNPDLRPVAPSDRLPADNHVHRRAASGINRPP